MVGFLRRGMLSLKLTHGGQVNDWSDDDDEVTNPPLKRIKM